MSLTEINRNKAGVTDLYFPLAGPQHMGIDMFNNNNKRSVGYRGGDLQ